MRLLWPTLTIGITILFSTPAWGQSAEEWSHLLLTEELTTTTQQSQKPEDPWLGIDKLKHVVVSGMLVGVSYHIYHDRLHNPQFGSRLFAISISATAGLLKEGLDRRKTPPTCSKRDLVADTVGIVIGVLLFTR